MNSIYRMLYKFVIEDSRNIFIKWLKIILLVVGAVIVGILALKFISVIFTLLSDLIFLLLILICAIGVFFGADISAALTNQHIQKQTAINNFNDRIVINVFNAVTAVADEFRFKKPDSVERIYPSLKGSNWYFALVTRASVLKELDVSKYDVFSIIQHYLNDIPPLDGMFPVVYALHIDKQNSALRILVTVVSATERKQILDKWYASVANEPDILDCENYIDEDF